MTVFDLFCGAGGLSEGFRQAGFRILGGADIDPDACATYARNFPEARPIHGSLRDDAVREEVLDTARKADFIIGGPPCQAFSQVRNHDRLLHDPRNSLYREFVGVIARAHPIAFLMENVPGMDQMGVREQIAEDLSLDGEYRVHTQVADAVDYGVPQTRKRLLFMGVRRDTGATLPHIVGTGVSEALSLARREREDISYIIRTSDSLFDGELLEQLQDPGDTRIITAQQAISDLSFLKAGRRCDEIATTDLPAPDSAYQQNMRRHGGEYLANVSVPRINDDTRLRLQGIPDGGNYRDLDERLQKRYLTGQKWGPHNGSGQLGRRHYYAYRRLHPEFWSWTLNTKADSVYHYSAFRALCVREFARIQSFPDSFVFTTDPRRGELLGRIEGGAAHSRYRQAGNAVPPLLARAVAFALAEVLDDARRPHESDPEFPNATARERMRRTA